MVSPIRKYDYMAGEDGMVRVPPYRPKVYVPNTLKYWWEDAACSASPAEYFEPALEGRADSNDRLTRHEVVKDVQAKLDTGHKLCNSCPVWHLCYTNAQPDDFFYTMRAGIEPAQFTDYKALGKVRYKATQRSAERQYCKNGHSNWRVWGKARPRRKCVDCSKGNARRQREKKSAMVD